MIISARIRRIDVGDSLLVSRKLVEQKLGEERIVMELQRQAGLSSEQHKAFRV